MKRNYLDSLQSYDDLMLDYFQWTHDPTGLYKRIYNVLFRYRGDTSFNKFMELVLSYETPYHFIMDQRNIGKKSGELFVKELPRFLKIYYNCQPEPESDIVTVKEVWIL